MMAALEDVEDVAKRSGLRRRHDADASRQGRDRLPALGGKQAFGFEFRLELLEGQLQGAGTLGLEVLGGNLELAAVFIYGHATADNHLQAIGRPEAEQARRRTEHHYTNLRIAIFEGEVKMAGIRSAEIGDLTFHPRIGILPFDVRTHRGNQIANFPHPVFRRAEAEAHLIGEGGHCGKCNAGEDGKLRWTVAGSRKVRIPTLSQRTRQGWGTRSYNRLHICEGYKEA